jgi:hypothetical protein
MSKEEEYFVKILQEIGELRRRIDQLENIITMFIIKDIFSIAYSKELPKDVEESFKKFLLTMIEKDRIKELLKY